MSTLPSHLETVRAAALAALGDVKAAGDAQEGESHALMMASRTDGGRDLPPYYLVYFLLVDLLGFYNMGQWEKTAWAVPIRYAGRLYSIEHRKMGLGIFAPTYAPGLVKMKGGAISSGKPSEQAEQHAREISALIKKAVTKAEPYYEWRAEQAAAGNGLNVTNNSDWLFERFEYLRDEYKRLCDEFEARKDERIVTEYPNGGRSSTWPAYHIRRHAEWTGQAAIDAFFTWTEHAFIHFAILKGGLKTGDEVTTLAEADWKAKFKAAFPVDDPEMKAHYDTLLDLRAQIRNFLAHGAFGKGGQAFQFHSGAGAVPVLLTGRLQHRYALSGKPAFTEKAGLEEIEKFITHLRATDAAILLEYTQSGLDSILTFASDGTYAKATASLEDMREFIEYWQHRVDAAGNMDW